MALKLTKSTTLRVMVKTTAMMVVMIIIFYPMNSRIGFDADAINLTATTLIVIKRMIILMVIILIIFISG